MIPLGLTPKETTILATMLLISHNLFVETAMIKGIGAPWLRLLAPAPRRGLRHGIYPFPDPIIHAWGNHFNRTAPIPGFLPPGLPDDPLIVTPIIAFMELLRLYNLLDPLLNPLHRLFGWMRIRKESVVALFVGIIFRYRLWGRCAAGRKKVRGLEPAGRPGGGDFPQPQPCPHRRHPALCGHRGGLGGDPIGPNPFYDGNNAGPSFFRSPWTTGTGIDPGLISS